MNRSVEAIKAFKLGNSKNLYNFLTESDMIAANLVEGNLVRIVDKKYKIYPSGTTGLGRVTLTNGKVAIPYGSQITDSGEANSIVRLSSIANTLLYFLRIRKTSTTAFNVQNDSSVDVFNVDTTNEVATGSAISTSATANKLAKRDSSGALAGNILGSASTVSDGAITNTKMSVMPTKTIKGNKETSTGKVQDLTVSEIQSMIQDATHRLVADSQITKWDSNISPVVRTYNTVAEMKADTNSQSGDIVELLGYYEKCDGCEGILKVMPSGSFKNARNEGGLWFTLLNGLTATWVLEQKNHISIRQLGGKDDNSFDNTPAFIRARQLEYWVIDFPYVNLGKYKILGYRPTVDGKDLEKGFYYNPLDERVAIVMEDLTPRYFGNLTNANDFIGCINPIKFEFSNQDGKDMIIGKNSVLESSYLSNSPKIIPEKNFPISLNFTDSDWEYYYTKDSVVNPSINGSISEKSFTWTANSATYSRQGFIRTCLDEELLEVACFSNNTLNSLYAYYVNSDGYCYMLSIPLGTNPDNSVKIYKISTEMSLIKTDSTNLTMEGLTADYFKIPTGGSITVGMRKNKNIINLYLNGILILTFETDYTITKMGIGTVYTSLSSLKMLYPVVYQDSKPKSSKNIKIYCLGDSNTVGARANMRWEDYLPYVGRSYAGIGEITIGTVNAAIDVTSGQVTPPDFSGHDYAIIMLGTNDSRVSTSVITQMETYKNNIQILINKAKSDGVIPILATFGMLFDGADTGEGYLLDYTYKSGAFINVLKTLAYDNNIEIAEVRNYIGNSWKSCYSDALHYTNVGHMEISKAISEALSRALNKFNKNEKNTSKNEYKKITGLSTWNPAETLKNFLLEIYPTMDLVTLNKCYDVNIRYSNAGSSYYFTARASIVILSEGAIVTDFQHSISSTLQATYALSVAIPINKKLESYILNMSSGSLNCSTVIFEY